MKILQKIANAKFKNRKTAKILFAISVFIAVFFLAFKAPADPDLFWHLKTGELMWQYKIIPHIDWYSYTMSDFGWIDHEWLSEILMFQIKNTFGWMGLAIFFAAVTALIFTYIIPKISQNIETKKYPFYACLTLCLLGAFASSFVFGQRPQIFSLLGFALILYVIKKLQTDAKSRIVYLLPFIFLIWANMHGGFILGFALLGMCLILDKNLSLPAKLHPEAEWTKLYRPLDPEAWKKLSRIAILSIFATFINPYGVKIYQEIFRTFSDNYGRGAISEWLSPNFHSNEGIIFSVYLIFLFIILCVTKKIDLFSFALLPFLLFFSLQSIRNVPIFIIASLPVLIRNIEGFEEVFSSVMQKKAIAVSLSILLIIYMPFANGIEKTIKAMSDEKELAAFGKFPKKEALDFLENSQSKNQRNILNDYGWGGYIIQNLKCKMKNEKLWCEPKVFIDGRMAHWITPEQHILKNYLDILNFSENWEKNIDKYNIEILFLDKTTTFAKAIKFNNEWNNIYEDDSAVIYEKMN